MIPPGGSSQTHLFYFTQWIFKIYFIISIVGLCVREKDYMHLHICMQVPVEAQSKILDLLKLELLAVVSPGTWSWEPNSDPSRSGKCSNH